MEACLSRASLAVGITLIFGVWQVRSIDQDGSGLSDIYEDQVLGAPSSPTADADLDGRNAREEWLLGGSDIVPLDLENLLSISPNVSDGFLVEIKTQPGLRLQLQESLT